MSELKPRITENGIDYILVGDYYIPDLKLTGLKHTASNVASPEVYLLFVYQSDTE